MGPRPVLLLIDVEPDARHTEAGDDGWRGCRAARDEFARLRDRFAEATGRPVRFNWFLRADPQIRDTWGRADHVAEACPDLVDAIVAAGDGTGIHPHLWRWSDARGAWFNDMADDAWLAECIGTAADAFRDIVGRPPESCRFGDRWIDDRAMRIVAEAGIRHDMTVEPGLPAADIHDDPHATGRLPDHRRAPRVPRRVDGGLWLIPVTTTPLAWRVSRRPPFVVRDSRSPNLALWPDRIGPHLEAETARRTAIPLVVVFRAGDLADPGHAAAFRATTDRWVRAPGVERLEFTVPQEAVARWEASG